MADTKVGIATRYGGRAGSFGIWGKPATDDKFECTSWISCRDHFQASFAAVTKFFFRITKETTGENVAAFIDKVESKLGLKTKTKIGPTNRSDCLWVRWSPFWRRYSMRRSLFSALLKASLAYRIDEDNFDEALKSRMYFKRTRPALDYFMDGNTVFTSHGGVGNRGWQVVFANVKDKDLPDMLRKPVKPATP